MNLGLVSFCEDQSFEFLPKRRDVAEQMSSSNSFHTSGASAKFALREIEFLV